MSLWVAPGSVAEESSSGSGGAYTPAHGEPTKVRCEIGTLCVIRTADGFRAIDDVCTHETASLSEGEYYDDTDEIECPLHASRLHLRLPSRPAQARRGSRPSRHFVPPRAHRVSSRQRALIVPGSPDRTAVREDEGRPEAPFRERM